MAVSSHEKLILMSLRPDLTYTARHHGFHAGDLKKLSDVFNTHGVKPVAMNDHDDLPESNEFFVAVSVNRCDELARDIQKCKAVTKLEVL